MFSARLPPLRHVGYVMWGLLSLCCSKKAKLEATSWSLSSNNLVLDEYYDSGVKLLDSGSETSEECVQEQKNGDLNSIINSGCAALTPTTKEKQVRDTREYYFRLLFWVFSWQWNFVFCLFVDNEWEKGL